MLRKRADQATAFSSVKDRYGKSGGRERWQHGLTSVNVGLMFKSISLYADARPSRESKSTTITR